VAHKHDAATLLNISTTNCRMATADPVEDGSFPWQRGIHSCSNPKSGQFEYNRILLKIGGSISGLEAHNGDRCLGLQYRAHPAPHCKAS
jgi:hypothetical protein